MPWRRPASRCNAAAQRRKQAGVLAAGGDTMAAFSILWGLALGYAVRLTVPRRGGWRAWGAVRADFEPAWLIRSIRRSPRRRSRPTCAGARTIRVTVALTVVTTDVADALTIGWDAFRSAARDDLKGWEVTAAAAEVQPQPPLTRASGHH